VIHPVLGREKGVERAKGEEGKEVDQVKRFERMIDWGNIPKPAGWDDDDDDEDDQPEEEGRMDDADEEEEVQLTSTLKRLEISTRSEPNMPI
jgi:hypothetical protein